MVESDSFRFYEKFLPYPKWVNGSFLAPKSLLFSSLPIVRYFFSGIILMTGINEWLKVTVFDFCKCYCLAQNGQNGTILFPNQHLIFSIKFLRNHNG